MLKSKAKTSSLKAANRKGIVYPLVIKFERKEIPAREVAYGGNQPPVTLPDTTVVFYGGYVSSMGYANLSYKDSKGKSRGIIFDDKERFLIIEGEERDKIISKFYKKNLDQVSKVLHHRFMIGTDPEFFVRKGDGSLFPAFEFLGSKEKPTISNQCNQGTNKLFWDGFQAEFDVKPNTCLAWMLDSTQNGIKHVLLEARKKDKKAKLSLETVVDLPHDLMEKTEPQYMELGCDPSYNAYTGEEGQPDVDHMTLPFRPAGGHMHFGNFKNDSGKQYSLGLPEAIKIVKELDRILGVATVAMFRDYDDPRRRELYGRAGEFRLPEHKVSTSTKLTGLEYRVLSNAWLCHPLMANIVFDLARKVVVAAQKNISQDLYKCPEEEAIRIINECDWKAAKKIMTKNKKFLLQLFQSTYHNDKASEVRYKIMHNGAHNYLETPKDLESNWSLGIDWITHCGGRNKSWGNAYSNVYTKNKKAKVA